MSSPAFEGSQLLQTDWPFKSLSLISTQPAVIPSCSPAVFHPLSQAESLPWLGKIQSRLHLSGVSFVLCSWCCNQRWFSNAEYGWERIWEAHTNDTMITPQLIAGSGHSEFIKVKLMAAIYPDGQIRSEKPKEFAPSQLVIDWVQNQSQDSIFIKANITNTLDHLTVGEKRPHSNLAAQFPEPAAYMCLHGALCMLIHIQIYINV